jgi:hypothetical protein
MCYCSQVKGDAKAEAAASAAPGGASVVGGKRPPPPPPPPEAHSGKDQEGDDYMVSVCKIHHSLCACECDRECVHVLLEPPPEAHSGKDHKKDDAVILIRTALQCNTWNGVHVVLRL